MLYFQRILISPTVPSGKGKLILPRGIFQENKINLIEGGVSYIIFIALDKFNLQNITLTVNSE